MGYKASSSYRKSVVNREKYVMHHSSFLAGLILILAVTWPTTKGQYDDAVPMDDMTMDEVYDSRMEPQDNAIRGMEESLFKRQEDSSDEGNDESSDESSYK